MVELGQVACYVIIQSFFTECRQNEARLDLEGLVCTQFLRRRVDPEGGWRLWTGRVDMRSERDVGAEMTGLAEEREGGMQKHSEISVILHR